MFLGILIHLSGFVSLLPWLSLPWPSAFILFFWLRTLLMASVAFVGFVGSLSCDGFCGLLARFQLPLGPTLGAS